MLGKSINPDTSKKGHYVPKNNNANDLSIFNKLHSDSITRFIDLEGPCPMVLKTVDDLIFVLNLNKIDEELNLYKSNLLLIDPRDFTILTQMELPVSTGSECVSGFVDDKHRLVMVNSKNEFMVINASMESGKWELKIEFEHDLSNYIGDSYIVDVSYDSEDNYLFVTNDCRVGYCDQSASTFTFLKIAENENEQVEYNIASCPNGQVIATNQALYFIRIFDRKLDVLWSKRYDLGSYKKLDLASDGCNSHPHFFGQRTGFEYVAIVTNLEKHPNVLVYESLTGKRLSKYPIFNQHKVTGAEHYLMSYNNSLYVSHAMCYSYAMDCINENSPLHRNGAYVNGIERLDFSLLKKRLVSIWKNPKITVSNVPILSEKSQTIYTLTYDRHHNKLKSVCLNARNGHLEYEEWLNWAHRNDLKYTKDEELKPKPLVSMQTKIQDIDPMQTAPILLDDESIVQGTQSGLIKISSESTAN